VGRIKTRGTLQTPGVYRRNLLELVKKKKKTQGDEKQLARAQIAEQALPGGIKKSDKLQ